MLKKYPSEARRKTEPASAWLNPGGWLMLEIGYDQAARAADCAHGAGAYDVVEIHKDFAGLDRNICLRKAPVSE